MEELTGWADYDREKLLPLPLSDKINYFFTYRIERVALNPLQRLIDHEIHPKDENGNPIQESTALLIVGTFICCVIEAAGKYVSGGNGSTNRERFEAFLHKYMNDEYKESKIRDRTYGDILWKDFRNGLAHGLTVCNGGYEGTANDPYFSKNQDTLKINPTLLFADLKDGLMQYKADLLADFPDGPLCKNFEKIFNDVLVDGK